MIRALQLLKKILRINFQIVRATFHFNINSFLDSIHPYSQIKKFFENAQYDVKQKIFVIYGRIAAHMHGWRLVEVAAIILILMFCV